MNCQQTKNQTPKSGFSRSDDEFSLDEHSPRAVSSDWAKHLVELQSARDRFLAFVGELGQNKAGELREDVLHHCEHNSKKKRAYESYLNDQMILRLINLRIQKYFSLRHRMTKNKRIKKNWSDEDVQILIWIVAKYSDLHGLRDVQNDLEQEDWLTISALIPGVGAQSCMFKWLSLKKINLATNNWSNEESMLLARLVKETGNKGKKETKDWKLISQRLYFMFDKPDKIYRNAKQCRQHWNCYLNPNLKKGPWQRDEDIQLLRCIKDNRGSKKWSQIVKCFDGRTENALKNRYTLIIDKQKKQNKHRSELDIIQQYLQKCYVDQFTGQLHEQDEKEEDESFLSIEIPMKKQEKQAQAGMEAMEIKMQLDQQFSPVHKAKNHSITSSPVKVKIIDFKNILEMNRLQLKFIQPGVLMNGVFQKSMNDIQKTQSRTPIEKLKLRKYNSALL